MGWLSVISGRMSILLCDCGLGSKRALAVIEPNSSALLSLDSAEVVAWSMLTAPTVIGIVAAR